MSGGLFAGWLAHFVEPRTLWYVAEPAARALLVALIAGLALVRTKDASLKFLAWKAVLAAALAMPFLGALVPGLPLVLPRPSWLSAVTKSQDSKPARAAMLALSRAEEPPSPLNRLETTRRSKVAARAGAPERLSNPGRPNVFAATGATDARLNSDGLTAPHVRRFPWQFVAAAIYLLVASVLFVRLALGWLIGRKLLGSATELKDPRIHSLLREQAAAIGLRRMPRLVASESVAVPVTFGAFAPVIMLPANSAEWDERKWRAVLAHELSHAARRDALAFILSEIHRGIFWFSPLPWWLDRRLRALAEQASDDWALQRTEDRVYYAELLLGFLKDLNGTGMRIRFEGASMAKETRMNERVERILSAHRNISRGLKKSVAVGAALVAAPVVYFAAALKPAVAPQEPAPPAAVVAPARPVAPAAPAAPAKPLVGVYQVGPAPMAPPSAPLEPAPPCGGIVAPAMAPAPVAKVAIPQELAPAPAAAPAAAPCEGVAAAAPMPAPAAAVAMTPVPPQAAVTPEPPSGAGDPFLYQGNDYDFEEGGRTHYVIVSGEDHISMSGNSDDEERAKALRDKIKGDYIWFHRGEHEYVITDPKTVAEAKALFGPQEELGRKQEALGKMQEELGAQQEELAKHMEEVRVKLPDLRKQIKELEERLSDIDTPRTQEQLAELQAELGEMQSRIGEAMSRAGGMQGEFGAKQGELGAKQGELGRRQGELGREQGRLAREANRKMKVMLEESIANGKAKPAPK